MPPCANNFVFNVLDFLIGLLLFVAGCASFAGTFVNVVIPLYQCFFGICIMIATLMIPEVLYLMIPFYMNFMGRGLTFLFLGCLAITTGQRGWQIAAAVFTIGVAFVYIVLWMLEKCGVFACSLPPPCIRAARETEPAGNPPSLRETKEELPDKNETSNPKQENDAAEPDVPEQAPPQQHDAENPDPAVYGNNDI